ncbi:MAG: Unknown protein, partial [uncultured Aureispira sp.]
MNSETAALYRWLVRHAVFPDERNEAVILGRLSELKELD